MKKSLFILLLAACGLHLQAQDQLIQVARGYLQNGNYEKAAATFKQLVEYNPKDVELQADYARSLLGLKDYKNAEKAVKQWLKKDPDRVEANFQLFRVYKGSEENRKAEKLFSRLLDHVPDLEEVIRSTSVMFEKENYFTEATAIYEKGRTYHKESPYLYAEELALLYNKSGNRDKAIESLLDYYVSRPERSEEIKATFQRLMAKPDQLKELEDRIQKRAVKNPDVEAYPDLMAWIYIQQKQYDKAFEQIKAIDTRMNEGGRRIMGFARVCFREGLYPNSFKAYDAVAALGKDQPYYQLARSEKLTCMKEALQRNPAYTQTDVQALASEYEKLLDEFPSYKQTETIREYAELQARYAHDIDKAIDLLNQVLKANNVPPAFKGRCKLEMGDYELVRNNIWDATLLYSQVDKEFKQDMLGEEARFRNAKLSYYSGDFEWAQGQLDVLKASTTELIANDALNLSVLITENNPPADSNAKPLLLFAQADLLEYQNKDSEALQLLDSIVTQFPQHPLMDDILMVRARIAIKKQDYSEAAMYYQKIVVTYADEVLADDALFQLAGINETVFKNPEEAKRLYEQLIVKYPGSTFVTVARKNFRRLRGDQAGVEDGGI